MKPVRATISLLQAPLLVLHASGNFIFEDFLDTSGLVFNGAASPTDCGLKNVYLSKTPNEKDEVLKFLQDDNGELIKEITSTHNEDSPIKENLFEQYAHFGHRSKYVKTNTNGCKSRIRLTPSAPSRAGSVWISERLPVLKGFDTTFTFQVTGHSRVCSEHVDPLTYIDLFKSCAVHGGDGFAFVIHRDEKNGTHSLGRDGHELGYGGISNSVAIEFDTWTNVKAQNSDDLFHDHISIHSASKEVNSSGDRTALGYARPVELADGEVHTVRILYLPYLATKYLDQLTSNDNLLPYLKDNGEGRRLGTMAVFIDAGVESDIPILAIPLNLSVLLDLPQSLAYVGFTASTGMKWETHDIITWSWCNTGSCHGHTDEVSEDFSRL